MNISNSKVTLDTKGLQDLQRMLAEGKNMRARVGILAGSKNERHDIFKEKQDTFNNATLGLVHEFGSVKRKIPPRSFLRVPLQSQLQKEVDAIGHDTWAALIKKEGMEVALKKLAARAENIVQEAFNTGGFGQWPQWSKAYARRRELCYRRANGKVRLIGPVNPGSLLILSSQLRKAITSQVVKSA